MDRSGPRPSPCGPGFGILAAAVLAVGVTGCALRPGSAAITYTPTALPPAEQRVVREQIRGHAKTHCGTCHQSTLPTAKPAALAIFNLDADDWWSTLTPARLTGGFPRRLNGLLDDAGRRQLRAFVEAELAR